MNPAELLRRIWYLLNRRRLEEELDREMRTHRELMAESGAVSPAFGNTLQLREQTRDVWAWTWLDTAWQDLRYAFRTLTPGYALTAGLILSLGIGLNLALFQIVNISMLRPPPVKDPGSLARFSRVSKTSRSSMVPYRQTQFVRAHNHALSAVLARAASDLAWGDDAGDRIRAAFVSANWFDELGYGTAARGRVFSEPTDERSDAPPMAVVSHEFWRARLSEDPGIVGKSIRLNDRPAIVIGVARPDFPDAGLEESAQVWLLAEQIDFFLPGSDYKMSWDNVTEMYGRFRPGLTAAAVKESLRSAEAELSREYPDRVPAGQWLEPVLAVNHFRTPADQRAVWRLVLFGAGMTLLVLLIACGNLGNLALSRATTRVRELSVRAALGASRWRILRQLLMESLLLAGIGSLGGLAVGVWGAKLTLALFHLQRLDATPDFRTFAAALIAGLVSLAAAGLAPVWRISRHDLALAMKDGGQQSSGSLERARLRKVLLAAQVSGSCLLLVVAGLMARGPLRALASDPGFDYEEVATLDPSLGRCGIRGAAARAWWTQTRAAIASHPETEAVAIVSDAPLGGAMSEATFIDAMRLKITVVRVEPSFFGLMKIPIVAGRNFVDTDDRRVAVIISRRLAMEMYGTANVVGRGFPKTDADRIIVGVAGDARLIKIEANNVAEMYAPLAPEDFGGYLLIARARTGAASLLEPMRQAARASDHRVLAQARLMRDGLDRRLRPYRIVTTITTTTGLLALALALLGLYGVVSLGAAARSKEIGIRLALGLPRAGVPRLLLQQQALSLVLGMVLGMAGAVAVGHFLSDEPLYLNPADVPVQLGVALSFVATAAAATLFPAIRVLRRGPLAALRHE